MPGSGETLISGLQSLTKGVGAFLGHGLPGSFSWRQLLTLFTASCTHLLGDMDQASTALLSVAFLSLAPKQMSGSPTHPSFAGNCLLIFLICSTAFLWCTHSTSSTQRMQVTFESIRPFLGLEPDIRISFAGCVSKLSHVISEVIPEGCASALEAAQSSHNNGGLATVGSELAT